MNKMIKFPLILAITGVVCATALGVVYQVANPIIEERVNAAANAAIGSVIEGGKGSDITKDFAKDKELLAKYKVSTVYEVKDSSGKKIGHGFKLKGSGRNGDIETLVILNDEKILGVKVLSQGETSSFYSKVEAANYEGSFKDQKLDGLDKLDTVAGATLSSKGIKGAVINARDAYKEIILGETLGPKKVVSDDEFAKLGYSGETFEEATEQAKTAIGANKFKQKFEDNGIKNAFYRKKGSEVVGYVYYIDGKYNCEVSDGARADQTYRALYSFDKDGANSKLVILESGDSLSSIGKPSMSEMPLIDLLQGFNINDVKTQVHPMPGKDAYTGATFTGQNITLAVTMICVNHKEY